MKVERSLVVFSSIPWDFLWQRPQALAEELAHHFDRCIYVEPSGSLLTAGLLRRQATVLANRRPSNVEVVTAPRAFLPYRFRAHVPMTAPIDRWRFARWLRELLGARNRRNWLFLIESPWWWGPYLREDMLRELDATVLYDCFDDFAHLAVNERIREPLVIQEHEMVGFAETLLATSVALKKHLEGIPSRRVPVHVIPNGVDFERFQRRATLPLLIPAFERQLPRVGFVGALGEWIDFELIGELAMRRPDLDFVLVGPTLDSKADAAKRELANIANILFTGGLPYDQVPAAIAHFDVCIVPFRTAGRMATVNSNKFYQYLAAGKPIVSVDLPEARALRPLVLTAENAQDFIAALDAALALNGGDKAIRLEAAAKNSWRNHATRIVELVSGQPGDEYRGSNG